jgi:purine-binding chemotaxis protein CheW
MATNTAEAFAQQFLTFRLGSETFAVDVAQVREILDLCPITKVPQMPDYMLGVINLRGSVVPVVDLRRKFGLPASETTRDNCIVVLEVDFAGDVTVVGAQADAVSEVLDLPADAIEPPPRLGMQLKTEFIRGMGKKDEEFIIILDIDRIFSSDELALLQEGAQ